MTIVIEQDPGQAGRSVAEEARRRIGVAALAEALGRGEAATASLRLAGLPRHGLQYTHGFYVYLLVDPRNDQVFYVGKGKGRRAREHALNERRGAERNLGKSQRLRDIRLAGVTVEILEVAGGLSERAALRLERQIILAARDRISNVSPGRSSAVDRMRADLQWSLSVFEAVMARPMSAGVDAADLDEYLEIARRSAEQCRCLLTIDFDEDEIAELERENRAEASASKAEVERLLATLTPRRQSGVAGRNDSGRSETT